MLHRIPRRAFLVLTGGALAAPKLCWAANEVPTLLDHILLGCNDLDRGIAFVEERSGVRAAFGGVHPGRGTENALLSLGERRYLEIIAPDPKQAGAQQFSIIDKLKEPRLIGWAAHPGSIQALAKKLAQAGIAGEGPTPGSRKRPDGKLLQWKTLRLQDDSNGCRPFVIEWSADSLHPSADSPKGCSLVGFEAATPEPENLAKLTGLLGLDVPITKADEPQLRATFGSPKGQFSLTS